jgi:urease accessory protein
MTGPGSLALLLADARYPAGGHAHSGGIEQAVDSGAIASITALRSFLEGRLTTAGAMVAFAAASLCHKAMATEIDRLPALWDEADHELSARLPSPASRSTSRRIGGQLLRSGVEVFPGPILLSLGATRGKEGPHHPVVLGAVGATAALTPHATALVAAYSSVAGPAAAAIRLLGLDPLAVTGIIAGLGPTIDDIADSAAAEDHRPLRLLPSFASPALDLLTEMHSRREERLFAS